MFDKLLEFIMQFLEDILPFKIINDWEKGVFLRFGKYHKIVEPGLILKIPFIDKVWHSPVITQTIHLQPQTLTTLDEKDVVLKAIVRYHVDDVKKFLLNVMHASDVLVDTTQGVIRDTVEGYNWEELYEISETLEKQVQEIAVNWGIKIERITLTDLGIVKTYRIMSDSSKPTQIIPE